MIAEIVGLGLDPGLEPKLERFFELFAKWNRRINLSGAGTGPALREQVADCLHVVPFLSAGERVVDVGSGGGLPVVVAALAQPMAQFVALEPVHKKHAFLRTAARELELANLLALPERFEEHLVRDFDVAMSRATFDLRDWLAFGAKLVHPGGRVIGFEAVRRADLDPVERHVYKIGEKPRAIVIRHRP
jgi:16S rRNA (guanine527-N7)-methyltransferase